MPIHDKSLSYKAMKMNQNAWYIQASLIHRSDIVKVLPVKYADTYKSMMDLYDNVIDNIWPEEPDDDAEFIQLCCFIELLEDMAEKTLVAANLQTQLINESNRNNTLERTNQELVEQLREKMQHPIEIDGVPMDLYGADWSMLDDPMGAKAAKTDQERINLINQMMQDIQNMQMAPPPISPSIPKTFWQQMQPAKPRKKKP